MSRPEAALAAGNAVAVHSMAHREAKTRERGASVAEAMRERVLPDRHHLFKKALERHVMASEGESTDERGLDELLVGAAPGR